MPYPRHIDVAGIAKQRIATDELGRPLSTLNSANERNLRHAILNSCLPVRLPANLQRLVPVLVLEAENPIQEAGYSRAAFGIDTGDVEQRRDLHRQWALVVVVGIQRAKKILRRGPQLGR